MEAALEKILNYKMLVMSLLKYVLPLKSSFPILLKHFQVTMAIVVSAAQCKRSFSVSKTDGKPVATFIRQLLHSHKWFTKTTCRFS